MKTAKSSLGSSTQLRAALIFISVLTLSTILYCGCAAFAADAGSAAQRQFSVDDILRYREVNSAVSSPDGTKTILVITRERSGPNIYGRPGLRGADRSDLWLVEKGSARQITDGHTDGAGFWGAVWSPDGDRIAMLSTRGGAGVRAYIFEMETNALRLAANRFVDTELNAGSLSVTDAVSVIWTSSSSIVFAALPAGAPSWPFSDGPEIRNAWVDMQEKMQKGQEPSVSIIEAGVASFAARNRKTDLIELDLATSSTRVLDRGWYRALSLSPDQKTLLASAVIGDRLPPVAKTYRFEGGHSAFATSALFMRQETRLIDIASGESTVVGHEVGGPGPFDAATPPTWSRTSEAVAFVHSGASMERAEKELIVVDRYGKLQFRTDDPDQLKNYLWIGEDFWVGQPDGNGACMWRRRLSLKDGKVDQSEAASFSMACDLVALEGTSNILGTDRGVVSILNAQSGDRLETRLEMCTDEPQLAWPRVIERRSKPSGDEGVIFSCGQNETEAVYARVSISNGVSPSEYLSVPRGIDLLSYSGESGRALFVSLSKDGTKIFETSFADPDRVTLLRLNDHIEHIEQPKRRLISYTSGDGEKLKALLLLPKTKKIGDKPPVIVRGYPGVVIQKEQTGLTSVHSASPNNLLPLVSAGYAVLVPSIPIDPDQPETPTHQFILQGMLPALDAAIADDLVDPERAGLLGHSYAGYAVYSLITLTDRFRAAAAIAGYTDLADHYLKLTPARTLTAFAREGMYAGFFEAELTVPGAVLRAGAPPWLRPEWYVEGSPINRVGDVTTPLLILHGEFDAVAISQAEQFYAGLARQRKRVRFIRYWGEGHNFDSPANIQHAWKETISWFDEHLREGSARAR